MDADKIKEFAIYHFEKLIVALVVLGAAFLVYSGIGKVDITQKHDPEALQTNATTVKRSVDDDHSPEVIKDRNPTFDIAKEQAKQNKKVDPAAYGLSPFDRTIEASSQERRKDPVLVAPKGIQTMGVIASIVYRGRDVVGAYPLAGLEPADPLEVEEERPKRKSRRRDRGAGGEMGMDEMGMGMGMGMDEMGMGMGMDEMGMGMGGGPGGDGATAAVRKLSPEDNEGYTPKKTPHWDTGAEQEPIPGTGYFIAGTAAIPHKEMIDSYQEALAFAGEYSPRLRDRPRYVAYQVQRADITKKAIDQLIESDWVMRLDNRETTILAGTAWSGFAPEIVPAEYREPGVTMWIPPVVLDPITSFATNPLVPLKPKRDLDMEAAMKAAEEAKAGGAPIDPGNIEFDLKGGGRAGGMMDDMGMGMGMGMDDMGMGMGMDDMGMGMEMGMGGGGAGQLGQPAEENPVDYKLLRFYDFFPYRHADDDWKKRMKDDPQAPKPGRTYVYRIRFGVNDPNFPADPALQPKSRLLDADAYARVSDLSTKAGQEGKRDSTRWSPWSETSAPSSLPKLDRSYFGEVTNQAKVRKYGNREIVVETSSPTAEVMASSFDFNLGVFIPTLIDATEGTVLSKKVASADVVDPITLEVKKKADVVIKSSATVIDIEGGLALKVVDDDPEMLEPGMFLMMDSDGKLHFRNTATDQKTFRIKSFADERGK